jgi:membrane protein implicated in regulation of membrane protease activity
MICLVFAESRELGLVATWAFMLAVLACGVVAIWWTYRWFRTLKQPQSEEKERVRAAIERQEAEMLRQANEDAEQKGDVETGRPAD